MWPVIIVYTGLLLATFGLVSLVRPLRFIGVRNRLVALAVVASGVLVFLFGMTRPAPEMYATGTETRFDEFAPVFQFREAHRIPVHAKPERIFAAINAVTADEIPLFRAITWIRRGGAGGPESILNPPPGVPLVTLATRTSFLKLAEVPNRELVIGSVVLAPPDVRLATGASPEAYKALIQGGFAKATMQFLITERSQGDCLLSTETRVFATDSVSRDRFGYYWRFIAPGSAALRLMWLRAIKVRAEAPQ
jgi:hypothetical protein